MNVTIMNDERGDDEDNYDDQISPFEWVAVTSTSRLRNASHRVCGARQCWVDGHLNLPWEMPRYFPHFPIIQVDSCV